VTIHSLSVLETFAEEAEQSGLMLAMNVAIDNCK
jgi:hypothetical protein